MEELLELPVGTLRDIRVDRAEVTFEVIPNEKNYNSTDVANSIGMRPMYFAYSLRERETRKHVYSYVNN